MKLTVLSHFLTYSIQQLSTFNLLMSEESQGEGITVSCIFPFLFMSSFFIISGWWIQGSDMSKKSKGRVLWNVMAVKPVLVSTSVASRGCQCSHIFSHRCNKAVLYSGVTHPPASWVHCALRASQTPYKSRLARNSGHAYCIYFKFKNIKSSRLWQECVKPSARHF